MNGADKDKELRRRLADFSARLERTREKIHSHAHREGAGHIEHLGNFEKEHETLAARLEQADASTWERVRTTLESDLEGLTDRFETWVGQVDEAYERDKG